MQAIADSGADTSCFPDQWAPTFGIDLAACEDRPVVTGAGITNHLEWRDPLRARIEDYEFELKASFGPIRAAVLGRLDFFQCFRVAFDERAQVTYLDPYE